MKKDNQIDINQYLDPNNIYNSLWKEKEDKENPPQYFNELKYYYFEEFKERIYSQEKNFANYIVEFLLNGGALVLKNSFDKIFLSHLKKNISDIFINQKSSFHKIIENCPNFYRNINPDISHKYAFHQIKETYYFFPWNDDLLNLYNETYKKWRVLKFLSGMYFDVWEKNTPKDLIVDRIQVAKYPPNSGEQELHQDPYLYQKFFMSVYLSKKGLDYFEGGMYFMNKKNEKIDLEEHVDVGDLAFGFGTLYHGVGKSFVEKNQMDNPLAGRWFMGLYSTVSDYVENKHTGRSAKQKN